MTEHELILQIQFAQDGRDALSELWSYLDGAPLFEVLRRAGDSTWQGDTPDAFREAVRFQCDRLNRVLDEIGLAGQHVPGRIAELRRQLDCLRQAEAAAAD